MEYITTAGANKKNKSNSFAVPMHMPELRVEVYPARCDNGSFKCGYLYY
jgi:hypothetical protein